MAKLVLAAATALSTYQIDQTRTEVYIGEAADWSYEDDANSGWTATNHHRDVWKETDVGESGAIFTSQPAPLAIPMDATKCPGPDGAHCYLTAGVKTRIHYSWKFDEPTKQQTSSVTVIDPDTETWERTVCYDPTGNFTGMPAASATVTRCSTETQFLAERAQGNASEKIRLIVLEDTPINIDTAQDWSQQCSVLYVSGINGGAVTFVDNTPTAGAPTSSVTEFTLFYPRTGSVTPRIILNNVRLTGSYDVATGAFARSKIVLAETNGIDGATLSLFRCQITGGDSLIKGSGANTQHRDYNIYVIDPITGGEQNYGVGFVSAATIGVIRGGRGNSGNLANTGDVKTGTVQDYNDHGWSRFGRFWRLNWCQNLVVERGSWTGGGYDIDQAAQPVFRGYSDQGDVGHRVSCLANRTCGRSLAEFGHASDGEVITNPPSALVACNNHDFHHQGAFLIKSHCGGVHNHSNVMYRPKIESDTDGERAYIFFANAFADVIASISDAAWQEPSTNEFDTYVYDGDAAFGHTPSSISDQELQTHNGNLPVVTSQHHILVSIGATGGNTAITALSRGDDFRAIVGGAADTTVTDGPPVDNQCVKRTNPTNIGAHHAPGSDVAVAAPTKPSGAANIIAVNSFNTSDVIATSEGDGWVIPDDPFDGAQFDITWYDNGVEVASNPHAPMFRGSYTSLTQRHRKTNRSGQTVSVTSAALT